MAGKEEEARVGMTWGVILAQEIPCQLRSAKEMRCLGNDLLLLELSQVTKKKFRNDAQLKQVVQIHSQSNTM